MTAPRRGIGVPAVRRRDRPGSMFGAAAMASQPGGFAGVVGHGGRPQVLPMMDAGGGVSGRGGRSFPAGGASGVRGRGGLVRARAGGGRGGFPAGVARGRGGGGGGVPAAVAAGGAMVAMPGSVTPIQFLAHEWINQRDEIGKDFRLQWLEVMIKGRVTGSKMTKVLLTVLIGGAAAATALSFLGTVSSPDIDVSQLTDPALRALYTQITVINQRLNDMSLWGTAVGGAAVGGSGTWGCISGLGALAATGSLGSRVSGWFSQTKVMEEEFERMEQNLTRMSIAVLANTPGNVPGGDFTHLDLALEIVRETMGTPLPGAVQLERPKLAAQYVAAIYEGAKAAELLNPDEWNFEEHGVWVWMIQHAAAGDSAQVVSGRQVQAAILQLLTDELPLRSVDFIAEFMTSLIENPCENRASERANKIMTGGLLWHVLQTARDDASRAQILSSLSPEVAAQGMDMLLSFCGSVDVAAGERHVTHTDFDSFMVEAATQRVISAEALTVFRSEVLGIGAPTCLFDAGISDERALTVVTEHGGFAASGSVEANNFIGLMQGMFGDDAKIGRDYGYGLVSMDGVGVDGKENTARLQLLQNLLRGIMSNRDVNWSDAQGIPYGLVVVLQQFYLECLNDAMQANLDNYTVLLNGFLGAGFGKRLQIFVTDQFGGDEIRSLDRATLRAVMQLNVGQEPMHGLVRRGPGGAAVGASGGNLQLVEHGNDAKIKLLMRRGGYIAERLQLAVNPDGSGVVGFWRRHVQVLSTTCLNTANIIQTLWEELNGIDHDVRQPANLVALNGGGGGGGGGAGLPWTAFDESLFVFFTSVARGDQRYIKTMLEGAVLNMPNPEDCLQKIIRAYRGYLLDQVGATVADVDVNLQNLGNVIMQSSVLSLEAKQTVRTAFGRINIDHIVDPAVAADGEHARLLAGAAV